jgi:hypothetical protein
MALETMKCSTIFVAAGEKLDVFHSVSEIPPAMRQRLLEATRGMQSATILIADRGGREQLLRAAQGSAAPVNVRAFTEPEPPCLHRAPAAAYRSAVITIISCALAAAAWFLVVAR